MKRIIPLLVVALVAWQAYRAYLSPEGRAKAAERAAIEQCRVVDKDANLSIIAMHEQRLRCDKMAAAYREKWDH